MTGIEILLLIGIVSVFEFPIIFTFSDDFMETGFSFLNPIRNYMAWESMNWFGVGFWTLIVTLICPVWTIVYWFYKLCTVGRR